MYNKLVLNMLEAGPINYSDWAETANIIERGEAVRAIDEEMQTLARIRGYLDMRYGSGCGDQGHKSAVKESNKMVRQVRKVLGFTYARQDLWY